MSEIDENSRLSPTGPIDALNCKPLLDSSTPELFLTNAFRITGLRADATAREIIKHADKLKIMEELGQGKTVHAGAFALKTPPTVDQIREAVQRLKDPELRIVDEFFWFWPKQFGQSASDPALKALEGGDTSEALKIWSANETIPNEGLVAMHNLAVLWHLRALESEDYYAKTGFTAENRAETDHLWRNAFKRWNLLAVDDLFWAGVSARIRHLDDPRIESSFSRRMQATLPYALSKINGEFALRYAENGQMDLAQVHVQFMREAYQDLANINKTAELVLGPTTARLKQRIQIAQQRAEQNSADALEAARELIAHAQRDLPLFHLFFGKESDTSNELSDEVATVCNRLTARYHKVTGDDRGSLEFLRLALAFAVSSEQRQQIETGISTLQENLIGKRLEPAYSILKSLQVSSALPRARLATFRIDAVPAIEKESLNIVESAEHAGLVNAAAVVLRDISLSAWNTSPRDSETAVQANELAIKFASDPGLLKTLISDQKTIRGISTEQKSEGSQNWGCLVLMGIIGLFVYLFSSQSSPSS
ncbi:MAG: hypothetical protein ORN83_15790, partial [Chthoniobacteraceae bacterium]|nr:hypothetical protein [Chthoniobacteraceae bacterium]